MCPHADKKISDIEKRTLKEKELKKTKAEKQYISRHVSRESIKDFKRDYL